MTSESVPTGFQAETQDLMNLLGRRAASQLLHAAITFVGPIDVARLSRAARLVLDAEPVLGCRLVDVPTAPRWDRRTDLDDQAFVDLAATSDVVADTWRFIRSPFDPELDPVVRLRVLRAADGADTLVVRLDHVAADIGGLKQYLELLSTTYRALGEDPGYLPIRNLGSRGQDQVFGRFDAEALAGATARASRQMPPAIGVPATSNDRSGAAFAVRQISPTRLARARSFGRARGATVNDLLLAALFRSLGDSFSVPTGTSLTVNLPIDLRRFLPDRRAAAVCNLSALLYPTIERVPGEGFEDTLARVTAAMAPLRDGQPALGAALGYERWFAAGYAQVLELLARHASPAGSPKSLPFLSNFGEIDPARLDFGSTPEAEVVDALIVGPVVYPPGLLVGVSTFRGTLTLSVGYPSRGVDGALIERILDGVVAALPE